MFRENNRHLQQGAFETTQLMHPRNREIFDKSWAPFFYEYVFCRIDEKPFSVLYDPVMGKPNFPVNILIALEYIKHMKHWTDEDLFEAFRFNSQVSYALGIRTVGGLNMAERTLYYFRERVYRYCMENPDAEDILFSQFVNLTGSFAKKAGLSLDEQRTDTTLFTSNIKKAGRISLAHDILAQAVKAIPDEKLTSTLAQVLEPGFKNKVLYRMREQEADGRLSMLLGLCGEADAILGELPDVCESDAARILHRFLDEQSAVDPVTGKLAPKPRKDISSGSLQSAFDEDATFRKKGNVSQSGYALELSETCSRDNPFQVITDYAVRPNNVSDQEIFVERMPVIKANTGCTDMYVDGGFHSDEVHKTAEENEIGIHLTNMSGTTPEKKLPVTAYEIDHDTKVIQKCPAGHAPTRSGVSGGQTSAHFPNETCNHCELQDQCHSKPQKKDAVVRITLKAVDASRIRAEMKEDQIENTSMRAAIEGTNSAVKRKGLDDLDVRGEAKVTVICGLKAIGQNITRFIRYMRGGYDKRKATSSTPIGGPVPNPS